MRNVVGRIGATLAHPADPDAAAAAPGAPATPAARAARDVRPPRAVRPPAALKAHDDVIMIDADTAAIAASVTQPRGTIASELYRAAIQGVNERDVLGVTVIVHTRK